MEKKGPKSEDSQPTQDKKIGALLVEMGLIEIDDLAQALYTQKILKAKGEKVFKVGELLLFENKITLPQLHGALRQQSKKAQELRDRLSEIKQEKKELAEFYRTSMRRKKKKGLFSNLLSGFKKK